MSAAGGILALHLGLRVGWSYGCPDDRPDHGVWRLPESDHHGEAGAAFFDAVGDCCKINRPTRIVITAPLTGSIADEIDSLERAQACCLQIGLSFAAKTYAYRRSIRVAVVDPDDVRQQMLGRKASGREMDDLVSAFARRHGWEPKHPAAGHALMLWLYARELRVRAT